MGEGREQPLKILEGLESSLETRAVVAFRRSPETFVREARTLELVIDLKEKQAGLGEGEAATSKRHSLSSVSLRLRRATKKPSHRTQGPSPALGG